jgi:hypothetical protein
VKTVFLSFLASMVMAQSAGTFTATGKMTWPRFRNTATLLTNGKVLIAGRAPTAELYDPSTGAFTATGDMITPRVFGASATLLPDGKVLFAGGTIGSNSLGETITAAAELYDPSTGIFAATGSMATAKRCPAAVLLPNGKVLVAGGGWPYGLEPRNAESAELYDPLTGIMPSTGLCRVISVWFGSDWWQWLG